MIVYRYQISDTIDFVRSAVMLMKIEIIANYFQVE